MNAIASTPLSERLGREVRGRCWPDSAEGFAARILQLRLPRRPYVAHLGTLRIVMAALERQLALATEPAIHETFVSGMDRTADLDMDLSFFGMGPGRACGGAWGAAMEAQESLVQHGQESAVGLLGALFVTELWVVKAERLLTPLASQLSLGGGGLAYYRAAVGAQERFVGFERRLDLSVPDDEAQQAVVRCSQEMSGLLGEIFTELNEMC